MPIYDYRCEECNFQIDLNRKVEDRDDLVSVVKEHCPKYIAGQRGKEIPPGSPTGTCSTLEDFCECFIKRVPTCGGFTI